MSWLKQICSALAYLESEKIIHHDLKPANIFIYGDQIKIGDFGLSKTLQSKKYITTKNGRGGTASYMAPEILKDEPYNTSSDLFALGCILYELCTLKLAFVGKTPLGTYDKIRKGKYDPIPAHLPYSDGLRRLVD